MDGTNARHMKPHFYKVAFGCVARFLFSNLILLTIFFLNFRF